MGIPITRCVKIPVYGDAGIFSYLLLTRVKHFGILGNLNDMVNDTLNKAGFIKGQRIYFKYQDNGEESCLMFSQNWAAGNEEEIGPRDIDWTRANWAEILEPGNPD